MRKLLATCFVVVCGVVPLQGCGRTRTSPTAPAQITPAASAVQAIQISGGSADRTFMVGQTQQLAALARLSDGSEQDVTNLATWVSDNPSAATVASGLVTAVGRGAARVRAAYQSASGETTFSIVEVPTTSAPPDSTPGGGSAPGSGNAPTDTAGGSGPTLPATPPTVQRLVITGDDTLPAGKSGRFHATAYMSDGSQKDVTGSSDWRTDNSIIGSISQSGLFTGLTRGSNVVTANYNGTSASQPVQVTPL